MTNRILLFATAMLVTLVVACNKPSRKGTYIINGTAVGFDNGATLQLTDADGQPIDTIVVSNGRFSYTGHTDSVGFYSLYALGGDDELTGVNFFTESGTINVVLNRAVELSSVGGTVANDAWQKLAEETAPYYEKMHEIEQIVYSDSTLSRDSEWALGERYMQLYSEINNKFKESARANAANEMGFMLATRVIDPTDEAVLLREVIGKMPEKFRQRQALKDLEARLKALEATQTGEQIADFSMNTPDGTPLSVMSEVEKNKVTILDFWASWCGPCRREMPFMKELYAEYHPKGLGIVGISLDESAREWTSAISDLKIEWPQISDLQGWNSAAAKTFQVNAIPYLLVLDSEGHILQKGLRGDELRQFIAQLLP